MFQLLKSGLALILVFLQRESWIGDHTFAQYYTIEIKKWDQILKAKTSTYLEIFFSNRCQHELDFFHRFKGCMDQNYLSDSKNRTGLCNHCLDCNSEESLELCHTLPHQNSSENLYTPFKIYSTIYIFADKTYYVKKILLIKKQENWGALIVYIININ